MTFQKKNKKGKPVGKAVLQGFILDFSTAIYLVTAGSSGHYRVTADEHQAREEESRPRRPRRSPWRWRNTPAASHLRHVDLAEQQVFAKGGEITVIYSPPTGSPVLDGTPLSSNDAEFNDRRGARYHAGVTVGFTPSRHRWIGHRHRGRDDDRRACLAGRPSLTALSRQRRTLPSRKPMWIARSDGTSGVLLAESACSPARAIHPAPENPIRPIHDDLRRRDRIVVDSLPSTARIAPSRSWHHS